MGPAKKILAIAVGCVGASLLASSWVAATAVLPAGLVTVRVEEREAGGVSFYLPLPAVWMQSGAAAAPYLLADGELFELRDQLEEWGPLLRQAFQVLDDCPDATLVEVEDGADRVRVRKDGGLLRIEVDEPDAYVEVSVPTRAAQRTVAWLLG